MEKRITFDEMNCSELDQRNLFYFQRYISVDFEESKNSHDCKKKSDFDFCFCIKKQYDSVNRGAWRHSFDFDNSRDGKKIIILIK